MIERHVSFHILEGRETEFEAFFDREYAPGMAKQTGFCGVTLLHQTDAPSTYKMVIRFVSEETAAGWRASAEHKDLAPKLKALYSSSELTTYTVTNSRIKEG